jgi:hypothetical protein
MVKAVRKAAGLPVTFVTTVENRSNILPAFFFFVGMF